MNNKIAYQTSSTITCSLASLATSSTFVAGRSSAEIDNTTDLDLDKLLTGTIMVGTTPTINTKIEVWVIPKRSDSTYHDTFDGTDKAVTVTSRSQLLSYGTLISSMDVPATTSNISYDYDRWLGDAVGGPLPAKFQLFITHNTGVNLNATGGNHILYTKGIYTTTA